MTVGLVIVGASLGGFDALKTVLNGLPAGLPAPVVVVQHQGTSSGELGELLQRYAALPVCEAEDKEGISPGRVYLAPAGYHLLVEPGSFALSTDAPVLYARPSIDVSFESAAEAYGAGVVGVVLTGAGRDGALGLAHVKRRGGRAIVQDPATARRADMPAAALASVTVDWVLPLSEIAPKIVALCGAEAGRSQPSGGRASGGRARGAGSAEAGSRESLPAIQRRSHPRASHTTTRS